jgi:hypothetical protein
LRLVRQGPVGERLGQMHAADRIGFLEIRE